jgi:hypothetical protein
MRRIFARGGIMVNATQLSSSKSKIDAPIRANKTVLPEVDYQHLERYLEDCEGRKNGGSDLLAYVLSTKLMNTAPTIGVHLSDVVVGGCLVRYSVNGEQPRTGFLTHMKAAELTPDMIAVASLLGATLIGMRVGQRAPLLNEYGTIERLLVIASAPAKSISSKI